MYDLVVRDMQDGHETLADGYFFPKNSLFAVDAIELGDIVGVLNAALARSSQSQPRLVEAPSSLIRLDVIDLALYKALSQHPELLRSLHWRTFENLLADILASFGYEIELQRGTKDGGVDLFAVKRTDPFGPQRFLLQAKRWSHKVDVEPVRQLAFLHMHERMTKSCLATTASFTRGAWQLASQYRWQLELRDFVGIQDWINQAAKIRHFL